MKATQFIKEHGLEKAREVVEGAPKLSECFNPENGGYYRMEMRCVNLSDLKRLVESMGIVERFGGIELSKEWISEYSSFPYRADLEQAIADYESIYGGGNE